MFFANADGNSLYRSFLIIKINDLSCGNIDLIKRYCFSYNSKICSDFEVSKVSFKNDSFLAWFKVGKQNF